MKNIFQKAILAVGLVFGLAGNANAMLIKQDLFSDTYNGSTSAIGSITIDSVDGMEVGPGLSEVSDWVSFNIFGYDMSTADVFNFFAEYETNNLYAGIQTLSFDLNDEFADPWAYSGEISTDFGMGDLVIHDVSADPATFVGFLDDVYLSTAEVPEPQSLAIFALALAGLAARGRKARS